MAQTNNTCETIYEVGKFSARINKGRDYEIVRNGLKVVETLKWDQYDEEELVEYVDKCENAHEVITNIKRAIDRIMNLDGSYHTFKNAVEELEQLDVPNYMSDDVFVLKRQLIRMMVWISTPLTTIETHEISMEIVGMMVNDLEEVKKTIHKIVVK